ncbi:MAG: hypothetical protein PHP26_05910 [Syntrophomonas sp.]|uniref:hypothetical protein n=1 Tax=Syntrophomonas sp. TaxID=2053627 RepID=UPI002615AC6B|nr:hypothetical protein [Syntrophomonas sp.]MDD2509760.1 hypothetical protein [Syntrophomonas sp.]MDD3879508.1 hypothetical protein [Syntrophomonas sp.]MDD4625747.1 hypothetical protein [Syntrophomonas sp.]
MNPGLLLLLSGLLLVALAYISYKRAESSLLSLKREDLVSYYLELALRLLPLPLWTLLLGILLILAGVVVLLVNLPRGLLS